MDLYTKNGKPLQLLGTIVYSRSGKVVGRIKSDKVFGTDGRYVGSIVGDRLVYRSTQVQPSAHHLHPPILLDLRGHSEQILQYGVLNQTYRNRSRR